MVIMRWNFFYTLNSGNIQGVSCTSNTKIQHRNISVVKHNLVPKHTTFKILNCIPYYKNCGQYIIVIYIYIYQKHWQQNKCSVNTHLHMSNVVPIQSIQTYMYCPTELSKLQWWHCTTRVCVSPLASTAPQTDIKFKVFIVSIVHITMDG